LLGAQLERYRHQRPGFRIDQMTRVDVLGVGTAFHEHSLLAAIDRKKDDIRGVPPTSGHGREQDRLSAWQRVWQEVA
jgi:hypothetical protein